MRNEPYGRDRRNDINIVLHLLLREFRFHLRADTVHIFGATR